MNSPLTRPEGMSCTTRTCSQYSLLLNRLILPVFSWCVSIDLLTLRQRIVYRSYKKEVD